MRVFIGVCCVLLLFSCQQIKEGEIIAKEVKLISKENGCELGFLDQKIDQSSDLIIKLKCTHRSEFFPGRLVLDFFERLNKEGIKRNRYSVKDSKNKTLCVLEFKDAQNILKKKKIFEEDFQLLLHSEKSMFLNKIHDSIKTKIVAEPWFVNMFEVIKSMNIGWEFEGVLVQEQDRELYTIFGKKLENEVIVWISYKLSSKGKFISDDRIYGVGVLPLNK